MNSSSGIPSRNLCIHRQKRFWVLCSLKFLVSFLFVILKIQKKNNVVIGMGAEKLNHFKTIVFIIMVGSVFFYTYLVGKFKQERLFYGILVMFLIAFSLYSFVLLPNLEKLQPQYATSWLACHEGSKGNFAYSCMMIWKNWVSVFFFCIAEFWGQYCIIILFWGVANELFSRQEAKKTYHYFIASGCFGGVAGTLLLRWVAQDLVGKSQEDQFLGISNLVGLTSIATTLTLLCLYHWIKRVFFNQKQVKKPQKSPHSFSFAKGIKFILTNPYLLAALLMVVGCAICGNLAQTTYEKYLEISGLKGKRTPCEYILFKVKENLLTNICCILTSLFVSGNIIRRFGWKALAYMAPIIMLVIGTLFLGASMLYQSNQTKWVYESIGLDGKSIMCSLGMLQSIASIFAKYAFFDISKALVYTGMDVEVRTKGRGMINVIGSRLGKLLSSLIQIGALSLLSPEESIFDITWLLWLVFCCFGLLWILSIRYIGGILKKQNKID